MTEEQIKQKAKKHADAYATPDLDDSFRTDIYEANKDGCTCDVTEATKELEAQIEKMKCCANCLFSESDRLNGTFCHKEGCFVLASAKCKLWER